MGRPSLAEQRKAEILDAFGRCVARFGLEGSSLEKIAEEASMKRSILRHYIGNRNELIDALAEKVIADYRRDAKAAFDSLPDKQRAECLVDMLLPKQPFGSTEQLLVIEALIGAASANPTVKRLVSGYVNDYVQSVAGQLKLISPKASSKACWEIAYTLVCISFNHESLQPLALSRKYSLAARNVAKSLVASLG